MRKVWILTGDEVNWDRAVADRIWGVRTGKKLRSFWEQLSEDDLLLFYVTSPISGVVGIGLAGNKFKQDKPLWADEIHAKEVLYPYRFELKVIYYLPKNRWTMDMIPLKGLLVSFQSGMNLVGDVGAVSEITERANAKWNLNLTTPTSIPPKKPIGISKEIVGQSLHNKVRDILREIGILEDFLSEIEYPLDGQRLDVAWRKVVNGVPTRVFEVQVGGNVTEALSKLKHANDLWNSEPFIVITDKDREKVRALLSGTFHEIADKIKVFTVEDVESLYQQTLKHEELKKKMGL